MTRFLNNLVEAVFGPRPRSADELRRQYKAEKLDPTAALRHRVDILTLRQHRRRPRVLGEG